MSNSISVQEVQDVPLQKLLQICKNKFSNLKLGLTENNKKLILKNDKSRLQKITLMTPQEIYYEYFIYYLYHLLTSKTSMNLSKEKLKKGGGICLDRLKNKIGLKM